jgi:fatty acid-binding protein DegV
MKKLFVLTEEISAAKVLSTVITSFLERKGCEVKLAIKHHQGKKDLITAIDKIVPTLSQEKGIRILVVIDQDNEDCKQLKKDIANKLEKYVNRRLRRLLYAKN